MRPVTLEIIVPPILEPGVGCWACRSFMEQAGLPLGSSGEEYPEELVLMASKLSQWLDRMRESHPQALKLELVDALSPRGIWKQIRHGLRALPGFLLNGKKVFCGWDLDKAEALIEVKIRELGMDSPTVPFLS